MKLRIHLAALAALSVFLALPAVAFAQTAAPPAPLPGLSESTVTIALLGAVAAFLVSAWNTGKVLGVATIPQTWLPYVALVSVFVGAGYASLSAAGTVSALALVNAGLAGFYALVAYSGGAAAHGAIAGHIEGARMAVKARLVAKAAAVKPLAVLLVVGVFGALCFGCLSSAPVGPVTPANQAQVSTCETTSTEHNGFVLGGIVVGAGATGMSGVAAAVQGNPGLQQGLAVGAAVAGGLAAVAAGGAGLTASSFASNHCTDVVGPLPMKPAPSAANAWPADWPAPHEANVAQDVDTAHAVMRSAGFVQPDGTTVTMVRADPPR